MIDLTQIELEILEGLLPRIEAERDAMTDNDDGGILLDDVAWWIAMTVQDARQ